MNAEEKLIEKLFSVGERLPARLKEEIVALGPAIEPQLRRLIDDDELFNVDARGQGWAPLHAVTLLGAMRAAKSIPRLVTLLASSTYDEYVWDRSMQALQAMGAPAFEPCLAAYATAEDEEVRSSLASAMSDLGVKDERLFELLVERLDREIGISASNLASYGDERGLPHLTRALEQYPLDPADGHRFLGQDVIELCEAIERLGGVLTETQRRKQRRVGILRERSRNEVAEPESVAEVRPGRNEPCWCGSGDKYKRCHLDADEQADREAGD
ncbi:MAG TPA: SEC-C domain-containing protein [Polyangia bacterium]|nr:SEC-C domain-containing protein [Polyangia bacterium]